MFKRGKRLFLGVFMVGSALAGLGGIMWALYREEVHASIGGELTVLALFDKPDPLDGPFFEETIYVTPSRLPLAVQIASLPEEIRGYGHVKARHLAAVRPKWAQLMAQWRGA